MFSLRDSSTGSSSGTDDSFGWWIGVDSHNGKGQETNNTSPMENPSAASMRSECCACSDDVSCHHSASSDAEDSAYNEVEDNDDNSLIRDFTSGFRSHSNNNKRNGEHIELCSLNNVDRLHQEHCQDELRAQCYTPERLVKDEDYRIVAPSPRFYRPSPEDFGLPDDAMLDGFRDGSRFTKGMIDCGKIEAAHLATLLQTLHRSTKSTKGDSRRCSCIQYANGEVQLHHEENCQENETRSFAPIEPQPYSEYGSGCDESIQIEFDCNSTLETEKPDVIDDSSGVSSVDPITETRTDDWSCVTEDNENALTVKLPRRLSDELAYASLHYEFSEKQVERISGMNEVVSILADLENNPNRVTDLLLEEDRFAQSGHDCLARLALAIEPDGKQDTPAKGKYTIIKNKDDPETELNVLRSKIERLQGSNKTFFEEIVALRRDFMKDEWKVNRLAEDVSQLRSEVSELRYLDDLLKLLKGELERVSSRNWPFVIGNTKRATEEINLVV